jgi:hypothetical protein
MSKFIPLREMPAAAPYKSGDVLVIFGELFSRGYANGIVDEAERAGLKIIRTTVGRREKDDRLRELNADELLSQPQPFINVPLEAGFDLEPCTQDGSTPVSQLAGIKLSEWENATLDWAKIASSRERGVLRFRNQVAAYLRELETHIPKGANVIFLHTMAGGVPRAKIIMPIMNRVFKGQGERHVSSELFWNSELGRLAAMSFEEVTANTLMHLIDGSQSLRAKIEAGGGSVRYLAYGYHGTEVLIHGEYKWQTYSPYVQGWAKMLLEDRASEAWAKGVKATVYNCPEILTNSSSIFQGVELPLYPIMGAMLREGGPQNAKVKSLFAEIKTLLKPEHSIDEILKLIDEVIVSEPIQSRCDFEKWPQHNSKEQMELILQTSDKLIEMHCDEKRLLTAILSEEIFRATGYVMFHDSWSLKTPVCWLGHDLLARTILSGKTL